MSKKKKHNKDFWGTPLDCQGYDTFDSGEVDIFSLGKVKKQYNGLESDIVADINKVFGNGTSDGEEVFVPNNTFNMRVKESEDYVSALINEYPNEDNSEIKFDPNITSNKKEPKSSENDNKKIVATTKTHSSTYSGKSTTKAFGNVYPIKFDYNAPIISLDDGIVKLYYKISEGDNRIRYIKDDITYDDSVIREIVYLIRDIIAFRHPSALYKLDEFEKVFDQVKGHFIDSHHETKYMFIEFDEYVAAYYFGDCNLMEQLKKFRIIKSNDEIADLIMGLAVESLDFNMAFTKDDFNIFYKSSMNELCKKDIIKLINEDIEVSDTILPLDVYSFDRIFKTSEAIISKYFASYVDKDVTCDDATDISNLEARINELIKDDIDDSDEDAEDEEDDDFELPDDDDEDDLEDSEEDDDESDDEDIDDLIDEAVSDEEEHEAKPIDKLAVNNLNKDQSMIVEVTRKHHP